MKGSIMRKLKLENHPCFNKKSAGCSGRIHLPVAPRCNIQCGYCNRKYDCVNESRPGVTSGVLSPPQALLYLQGVMERNPNISVVGIAGPGDPFANPEQTMETLRLIREAYPEMLLCVSTNGLNVLPYIPELAKLDVTHLTITMNTLRPETAESIYSWMRIGKRVRRPGEGAPLFLEAQQTAMRAVKEHGLLLKVNFVLLPGINDGEVEEVAKFAAEVGADLFNVLPYQPAPGSVLENLPEPGKDAVKDARTIAEPYLPQMTHCARCRADAVGLLAKDQSNEFSELMAECAKADPVLPPAPTRTTDLRPFVAVASREGMLVNQHLGEAPTLRIFTFDGDKPKLVEERETPPRGNGNERWLKLAHVLAACRAVVVSGAGDSPKRVLSAAGIEVVMAEGLVDEIVDRLYTNRPVNHLAPRCAGCSSCSGTGTGCG
jgi:nitrogen fixation protein NifB